MTYLKHETEHQGWALETHLRGRREGFALIEVLIATVIGVSLMAGSSLLVRNISRQRLLAHQEVVAASLAQGRMEQLLVAPAASLASGGPVYVDDAGQTAVGQYGVTWTVSPNTPRSGLARLEVAVTRPGNSSANVRLKTNRRTS